MLSLKTMLAATAVGVLLATAAFAQTGATGNAVGGPTGGGLTPATPPPLGSSSDPSASPTPPRPTESTPAPGLDNPTGAIPGTFGSTPSGIGGSNPSSGAITAPRPQGGTAPSTTPGSSTIQR